MVGDAGNDTITVETGTTIANGVSGDGVDNGSTVTPSPNPGNDTITVNGTVTYVAGNGGDDTITVGSSGNVTDWQQGVFGDDGPYATVGGNDTITIEGHVEGTVDGGAGDDTIIVSATVNHGVSGGYGDDTIILQDGAGGTDGYSLYVYGYNGNDTLVFQ
jgi:hypothetical protein